MAMSAAAVTVTNPETDAVPTRLARDASLGYQQLLSAALATSAALTVPSTATVAYVQNNGNQPVRWRTDGAPTTTIGMRIDAGEDYRFAIGNAGLNALRFIRETDGAILDVVYFA